MPIVLGHCVFTGCGGLLKSVHDYFLLKLYTEFNKHLSIGFYFNV